MNDWPTNRAQKAAIEDIKKARHGVHSEINSKSTTQSKLKSTTLIGLEGGHEVPVNMSYVQPLACSTLHAS